MSAREQTVNKETLIQIKPSHGLSPDKIQEMLSSSNALAEEDKNYRLLKENIVEAERAIYAIEEAIKTDGKDLLNTELNDLKHKIKMLRNNNFDYLDMLYREKLKYGKKEEIIIKLK